MMERFLSFFLCFPDGDFLQWYASRPPGTHSLHGHGQGEAGAWTREEAKGTVSEGGKQGRWKPWLG